MIEISVCFVLVNLKNSKAVTARGATWDTKLFQLKRFPNVNTIAMKRVLTGQDFEATPSRVVIAAAVTQVFHTNRANVLGTQGMGWKFNVHGANRTKQHGWPRQHHCDLYLTPLQKLLARAWTPRHVTVPNLSPL